MLVSEGRRSGFGTRIEWIQQRVADPESVAGFEVVADEVPDLVEARGFAIEANAVRHCGRYPKTLTWHDALKQGVRGATVQEIVRCLGASKDAVQIVRSVAPDARDMLEVWWRGECRKTGRRALAYSTLHGTALH